jgi:hypothetical protein
MNNLIYRIIILNFKLFLETGFLNFFGGPLQIAIFGGRLTNPNAIHV